MPKRPNLTKDEKKMLRERYIADQTLSIAKLARQTGYGYYQVKYAVCKQYRDKHLEDSNDRYRRRKEA